MKFNFLTNGCGCHHTFHLESILLIHKLEQAKKIANENKLFKITDFFVVPLYPSSYACWTKNVSEFCQFI